MKDKKITDSDFLYNQDEANHENCHYDFGKYIEYNGLNVKGIKNQLVQGYIKEQKQ